MRLAVATVLIGLVVVLWPVSEVLSQTTLTRASLAAQSEKIAWDVVAASYREDVFVRQDVPDQAPVQVQAASAVGNASMSWQTVIVVALVVIGYVVVKVTESNSKEAAALVGQGPQ